jgi:putative cell wall-binding protein
VVLGSVAGALPTSMTHDENITTNMPDHVCGVATDKFGNRYAVSQESDWVWVYDADGAYVGTIGDGFGSGAGELNDPRDVAVDRWNRLYVAEKANRRVSVFLTGGLFQRHISGPGATPDTLSNPNGIAVSHDGYVYVSDDTQNIRKFDAYGDFIDAWVTLGPALGVACDEDDNVWIANAEDSPFRPDYHNTVVKLSPSGVLLDSWGTTGTAAGQFDDLYDVDVDPGGLVYTVEVDTDRGQVFTGDGTSVMTFSTGGNGATELFNPYGIAAGPNRSVSVADTNNHRVSVWDPSPNFETHAEPLAGANRYSTAAKIAREGFFDPTQYVVVTTGENWPDALSGATLCGVLDAPLLLTDPDALSSQVVSELIRLDAGNAYVLGGPAAVSDDVFDDLEGYLGVGDVTRLGGANRYETSNLIATEVIDLLTAAGIGHDGTAFVTTGEDFPDALAVSPIAAANHWPIYLTRPDALPTSVATAMQDNGATHGYVIGGESAVSAGAFADILATSVVPNAYGRYWGANRYATARAVAEVGYNGMGMLTSRPAIATGENFPDALAGGALQGSDYNVLLLTPSDSLHSEAAAYLDAHRDFIYELRFLGGTGAVSAATRADAMAHLH